MGSKSTRSNNPSGNTTKVDGHLLEYFRNTFRSGYAVPIPPPGPGSIVATGGFISDYEDPASPGVYWRSHTFTSSGTFYVSSVGDPAVHGPEAVTVEYLVVGGGGGGGGNVSFSPYPWSGYKFGYRGGSSEFDASGPTPISSTGGGGGAVYPSNPSTPADHMDGGSGGGGSSGPTLDPGGSGTANQGYPGGVGYFNAPNRFRAGGGGGAGGDGYYGGPSATAGTLNGTTGMGGAGLYTEALDGGSIGLAGGGSYGGRNQYEGHGMENYGPNGVYGGGGGGSALSGRDGIRNTGGGGGGGDIGGGAGGGGGGAGGYRSSISGELSGGGASSEPVFIVNSGTSYSVTVGAGGYGSSYIYPGPEAPVGDIYGGGGRGGSGVVCVRYKISELGESISYKASGGQVYQWVAPASSPLSDGSTSVTVHVFASSGTFVTPSSFSETCEYVILGGGGGGGSGGSAEGSGGGGAGGYLTGTTPIGSNQTINVTVGSGGRGGQYDAGVAATPGGNSAFGPVGSRILSYGGGKGGEGITQPANNPAAHGGSGGGRGAINSGVIGYGLNPTTPAPVIPSFPAYTPGTTQGYPGGAYNSYAGGGGGGASGAGADGVASGDGGPGGPGIRLPATFQNPAGVPYALGYTGPGGTGFWVAGGGGGGTYAPGSPVTGGGRGGGPGGPFAGAGNGGRTDATPRNSSGGCPAKMFSGSGGGGNAYHVDGYHGGSGLVLIAYPS